MFVTKAFRREDRLPFEQPGWMSAGRVPAWFTVHPVARFTVRGFTVHGSPFTVRVAGVGGDWSDIRAAPAHIGVRSAARLDRALHESARRGARDPACLICPVVTGRGGDGFESRPMRPARCACPRANSLGRSLPKIPQRCSRAPRRPTSESDRRNCDAERSRFSVCTDTRPQPLESRRKHRFLPRV